MFFSCICVDLWSLVVSCNPLLGLLSGMKVMFKKKKKKKKRRYLAKRKPGSFPNPLKPRSAQRSINIERYVKCRILVRSAYHIDKEIQTGLREAPQT
jgi:hypothetical protein